MYFIFIYNFLLIFNKCKIKDTNKNVKIHEIIQSHLTSNYFLKNLQKTLQPIFDGFMDAGEQNISADISALPSGTYFLRLKIGNITFTEKIIVNH